MTVPLFGTFNRVAIERVNMKLQQSHIAKNNDIIYIYNIQLCVCVSVLKIVDNNKNIYVKSHVVYNNTQTIIHYNTETK